MMTDNQEEYVPPKRAPPTLPKNASNNNLQGTNVTTQQTRATPTNEQPNSNLEDDEEVQNIPKRAPPRPPPKQPSSSTLPPQEQKSNSGTTNTNTPTPSQNDPKPQPPPLRPKPALPPKATPVDQNPNAKTDYRYSQQVPKTAVPPSLPPKPVTLRPGKTDWNEPSSTQASSDTSSTKTNNNNTPSNNSNENSPRSNPSSPRTQPINNNTQPAPKSDPPPSSPKTPSPNSSGTSSPSNSNPPSNPNSNPSSAQNSPRTTEAPQPNKVIREGFLVKKGHKRTNWLIRWFRLTNESLSYYSSPKADQSSMKGSIPLNNPSDIQIVDKVDVKKRDNCFIIRVLSHSKEYVIDAQTQTELQQWLAALRGVLKVKHEVIQTIIYEMQQK